MKAEGINLIWELVQIVPIPIAFMWSKVQPVYVLIQLKIQHTTSWIVVVIMHKELFLEMLLQDTPFNLKILLCSDSDIDHDRNAVIVQAVHDYVRNSEQF